MFAIFKISGNLLPILPAVYSADGNLISHGFYTGFSHSLYLQTNAAGAIFGYATCLFYLFASKTNKRIYYIYMAFAALGLVLSRALAPLAITLALFFIATNVSFRRKSIYSLLSLLVAAPLFANSIVTSTLAHKINTSFLFKLKLLKQNLILILFENQQLLVAPKFTNFDHTENSFIDLCFQYGFLLSVLFYLASFLLIVKFIKFNRAHILVLFPLFLSFFQNSVFSPPVMFSFTLGFLFIIYICNNNQVSLQSEFQTNT